MSDLSPEEFKRYSRHLVMPEVTLAGQQRLRAARILCVGAGGLGSPASLYLAAAGIGALGLVDDDVVSLSNLQRQVLYATDDVGEPKGVMAARRLQETNPHVNIEIHETRLVADNVMDLIGGYDLVVDGSDNFPTRYLVNDACVLLGKPLVYGSVLRFAGQVSLFDSARGPCYRCLFPEPPAPGTVPSCAEGGVLGVLPGIIGSLQALEAIKWIIGTGETLTGRLLLFEGLGLDFREVRLAKDPECPVCGLEPTIRTPSDLADACEVGVSEPEILAPRIGARALARALESESPPRVLDVRRPEELQIAALDGAMAIPLGELPGRLDELPAEDTWVITCHKGARAERAWRLLHEAGYDRIQVLDGGIDAWAERVEPAMPRYA